eukprot:maker-scaffold1055_size66517-snap-gene-0.8 protein:Tk09595 transcript:maker-scaffold1055_size66517-snap-gene-0.8-mRNA-1 annotation:"PREDICTED: uncharacterized protein K02A2.6-like"
MRSFSAIILPLVVVASVSAHRGHSDYHTMKQWMMDKAFASCLGEENLKTWQAKKKKFEAECAGEDAPELDLPFFRSPYRVTSGLMGGAYSNPEWADEMVKKYMFHKMMNKMMRHSQKSDDDDDIPFFKRPGAYRRFRRDDGDNEDEDEEKEVESMVEDESTEGSELDLGDRLLEKLNRFKKSMQAEIGNMTCALQKAGVINEKNELQLEAMIAHFDNLPQPLNPWLKEQLIGDKKKCYAYAQALPQEAVRNGQEVEELRNVQERVSIVDEMMVLDGRRIVVPRPGREELLLALHSAHVGKAKMYENAKSLYYWPRMRDDVNRTVSLCDVCGRDADSLPMEPLITSTASMPMEAVGLDLFELDGVHWLVMIDRFSGYPFLRRLGALHTGAVISALKDWWYEVGFPARVRTDGGPQFRNEFCQFLDHHDVVLERSSPYNPRSNGLAEAGVKSMKKLVQRVGLGEPLLRELLEWRNTPRQDGISPSTAFLGRRMKGRLPALSLSVVDFPDRPQREFVGGRPLAPLDPGQRVQDQRTKRWNQKGLIVKKVSNRTYEIKMDRGLLPESAVHSHHFGKS